MTPTQAAEELAQALVHRDECQAALRDANERLQRARDAFNALPHSELAAVCRRRLFLLIGSER